MYPHRIRLRGPWEVDADPNTTRVTMPARWGEIRSERGAGVVRLRRRFGLPRHIDDWERVWLVCEGMSGSASWSLNGGPLVMNAGEGRLEAEITSRLSERNELTVELASGDSDRFVWNELALEIRCRAYLRDVRAVADRVEDGWLIRVIGEVVRDHPGDSLELYALIDGANQDYQQPPTKELVSGVQFKLPWKSKPDGGVVTVRVDLVNVSTIWHTSECVVRLGD
jgi:hypothetical protein